LYGLKQAPRAWSKRLSNFLIQNDFVKGDVDTTLFIRRECEDILLVQIYVDDIIFGSSNENLCKKFSRLTQDEFKMSVMRELTFFLGLQIQQEKNDTVIFQEKYGKELVKKFKMENSKKENANISLIKA